MARFQVFPGVQIQEQTIPQIIRRASQSRIGLIVDTLKGPAGDSPDDLGLNTVTSVEQYLDEYGLPETALQRAALTVVRATEQMAEPPFIQVKRALSQNGGDIDTYWAGMEIKDDGSTKTVDVLASSANIIYPLENYSPGNTVSFALFAQNPGEWGNNQLGVTFDPNAGASDEFLVEVWTREDATSSFGNEPEEEFLVTLDDKKDQRGQQMEIEERINVRSDYIDAVNNPNLDSLPPEETTPIALGGGDDGSGVNTTELIDAAQVFRDEDADVRMLIDGGFTSTQSPLFANELFDIAASRKDMVAILSTPIGLDSQEIIDDFLPNLTVPPAPENSGSYGTLWNPWQRDFEPLKSKNVLNPPSAYFARNALISFFQNEPWFAVAGRRRGPLGTRGNYKPGRFNQGDQANLYAEGVNSIIQDEESGPTLWGNKTLQTFDSPTLSLNVRFLLITLEVTIARFARNSLFEPNDEFTRQSLRASIRRFLSRVAGRRGLDDFDVIISEENNPPSVRGQGGMVGDIIIVPTFAAENIKLNFRVSVTGEADFSENLF